MIGFFYFKRTAPFQEFRGSRLSTPGSEVITEVALSRSEFFLNMGLWNNKLEEGMAKIYKGDSPLAKSDGQRYGIVTNVMCYFHAESKKHF